RVPHVSTRRNELVRQAARLFAEKGYHGTSTGDLAEAMGVQKGSLYAHIRSKADLLWEVAREGAEAFHAALDEIPDDLPATEKIRLALRAHLRVVAEQLDVATVFIREWRYLEDERMSARRPRLCLALATAIFVLPLGASQAATPQAGTIGPNDQPLTWQGPPTGGASASEATCVEGLNCDTFTLTVGGAPADWTG